MKTILRRRLNQREACAIVDALHVKADVRVLLVLGGLQHALYAVINALVQKEELCGVLLRESKMSQ